MYVERKLSAADHYFPHLKAQTTDR